MVILKKIIIEKIGQIPSGQDGAIFGGYIFRLDTKGNCSVTSLGGFQNVGAFKLDKPEVILPHSNSVCFGSKKYCENDEFPLLYTNVYNNYKDSPDKKEGICCVYRILRGENEFSSELVQIIKLGFTEKRGLWRSLSLEDVRPYGNFAVDKENSKLYAFTMLDENQSTRFFEFDLPKPPSNKSDGLPVITVLSESDIVSWFDCDYSNYIQGAVCGGGYIVSAEGFSNSTESPPRLRVFDINQKRQTHSLLLSEYGCTAEPEMVEIFEGKLFYSDRKGNFYTVSENFEA